jgi:hypothetical protein
VRNDKRRAVRLAQPFSLHGTDHQWHIIYILPKLGARDPSHPPLQLSLASSSCNLTRYCVLVETDRRRAVRRPSTIPKPVSFHGTDHQWHIIYILPKLGASDASHPRLQLSLASRSCNLTRYCVLVETDKRRAVRQPSTIPKPVSFHGTDHQWHIIYILPKLGASDASHPPLQLSLASRSCNLTRYCVLVETDRRRAVRRPSTTPKPVSFHVTDHQWHIIYMLPKLVARDPSHLPLQLSLASRSCNLTRYIAFWWKLTRDGQ